MHFNNGKVHFQPVEVEHYSLNTFDLCFSNCRVRLGDDCIEIFNRCDRSDVFRGPVLNSDCEIISLNSKFSQQQATDALSLALTNNYSTICSGDQGFSTQKVLSDLRSNL